MNAGNTLVLKRTFPASCERLFAMWTSAELMMKWFCPSKEMEVPVAEVDAREGGSYRIVMQNKDGETYSPSASRARNSIRYFSPFPTALAAASWRDSHRARPRSVNSPHRSR